MINPRVTDVKAEENYTLKVWFSNGEVKRFDVKPYLDYPVFKSLKENVALFNTVFADGLGIEWKNESEASLCPDTVYMESTDI
jgi:hypothetical protein